MGIGETSIPLSEVKNILRIFSASGQPLQVLEAENWDQVLPSPKNGKATKWFLKAGEIATDTSGTTISQWATIPALATIDIDVAWEQPTVNWWLTIGEPRRMELQVRKLQNKNLLNVTLLVENSRDADVMSVQIPYPRDSNLALRLLCDADKGAYALMMDDTLLGRIKGNPSERIVGRNKFSFTNTALGVLTLRDLRISDRPFAVAESTTDLDTGLAEVMTRNRGTFVGSIEGADKSSEIIIRSANDSRTRIALDEMERIEFSKQLADPNRPARVDLLRVDLANGLRFASEKLSSRFALQAVGDKTSTGSATNSPEVSVNELCLEYASGLMCIPWEMVERVSRVRTNGPAPADGATVTERAFRFQTEDTLSTGRVDSVYNNDAGVRTLLWFPKDGVCATPIHPSADGVIEPIIALPETPEKKPARTVPMAVIRADMPKPEPEMSRELRADEPSIFLSTGDCFPGKVMSGDEQQLEFQSSLFESTVVPAVNVRGIRIVGYQGADTIDRAARARILTLPRVQRKNPPTHLVVSRDGDIVRGRLVSFDRDEVRIEVRGDQQKLSMKNVAELIWLEPAPKTSQPNDADGEGTPPEQDGEEESGDAEGMYQVLLEQGSRVSISPHSVTRDELVGDHPMLGPCTLPWDKISRLTLGKAIRVDMSRSRFGKWKLQNAPDPKFVIEGTSEQSDAPVDTAHDRILGRPAPEQDLPKLDGTPFRIADYRGKVLILDFWASWCGPCIQSMPRIHQIARQFTDAGVEAVFVNIEESEDRVRALLERLELVPVVALDGDGSFAKQYAVQAIPQTVVIDRDGTILKVFVGAGENTHQELVQLLMELAKN
jgi:thiol-disulfide isomerase/thioredoxin